MPAVHVLPLHGVAPVQHGSPEKPHSEHWLVVIPAGVLQTVSVSVQTSPGQHGSSMVPHEPQKPFDEHTWVSPPSDAHVAPEATQSAVVLAS
jgi:hypothetical protein